MVFFPGEMTRALIKMVVFVPVTLRQGIRPTFLNCLPGTKTKGLAQNLQGPVRPGIWNLLYSYINVSYLVYSEMFTVLLSLLGSIYLDMNTYYL